jgi:hypothetical protein
MTTEQIVYVGMCVGVFAFLAWSERRWLRGQWYRLVHFLFLPPELQEAAAPVPSGYYRAVPPNHAEYVSEDDKPTDPVIPAAPIVVDFPGKGADEGKVSHELLVCSEGPRVGILLTGPSEDLLVRMTPDQAEIFANRILGISASVRAEYARKN